MSKTSRQTKYWYSAENLQCSLCGKHGNIRFKDAIVCENCLKYVKTNY
jgi:uncharacterized membrane protein